MVNVIPTRQNVKFRQRISQDFDVVEIWNDGVRKVLAEDVPIDIALAVLNNYEREHGSDPLIVKRAAIVAGTNYQPVLGRRRTEVI